MDTYRLSKTVFIRNRTLNFPTLILDLLNLRKHSNQTELDQFFKGINKEKEASQVITKPTFFQARMQLSYTAFIELNHQIISSTYKSPEHLKTWCGFRLCAINGSSVRLQNTPDITAHFGVHKGCNGQANCTMGMASVFYDVLNYLVIDSCLHPTGYSERACAADHMQHATQNDLVIYDSGYPAFWLYALHIKNKNFFCMRTKTQQSLVVKAFVKSNKREEIIEIKPQLKPVLTEVYRQTLLSSD